MKILLFLLTLMTLGWSAIGNIGALKGNAIVTRSSVALDAKNGMALEVKDKISTSDKSRVQVILKDNTVVTIGPNSTFVFDAYKFGGKDDSEVKMHINRGFFRSVTGKIGKLAPERFKVKTASATIGIRGTDFSAKVAEQKETISCYKGGLDVLVGKTSHIVKAGMMLKLVNGEAELAPLDQSRTELRKVGQKVQTDRISAAQIADVIQQEALEQVKKQPLEEPTVEFHDR